MTKKNRPKRNPRIVEDVHNSEDEEIDEDEAFNSDDERKYGSFFAVHKKHSSDEVDDDEEIGSESDVDEDDDDDDDNGEGDGGQYMLELLDKLDAEPEVKEKGKNTAAVVQESEFAAAVLKPQQLTLDDLMSGLSDTKGFGVMQSMFKEIVRGKATSAPVAKVVSERIQRKVAYEHSSKDVSGWIEAVQQNRQAETLDFRPKARPDVLTKNQLVDKFEPTTDFEKELADALREAGQHDEQVLQRIEEESMAAANLGSNELNLEEYQKRRSQLAKMRALMFYHEQKRHHINKIKSKKYRRIRKKQRERLKESEEAAQIDEDPDLVKEMEEKEEMARVRERMTLAHKNTSKWAKQVLKRGKNVDLETRRALSAQLARGDALRRKMNSTTAGEKESDNDSESEDLVEMARKVLTEVEDKSQSALKGAGLFQLSFMQKGMERQRERAKEEARQLLLELEANERSVGSDEDHDDKQPKPRKKTAKVATANQMKGILTSGKLMASSLDFGSSDAIAMSGTINIDTDSSKKLNEVAEPTAKPISASEHSSTIEVLNDKYPSKCSLTADVDVIDRVVYSEQSVSVAVNSEENPWLAAPENPTKDKRKSRSKGFDRRGIIDVDGAASVLLVNEHKSKPLETLAEKSEDTKEQKIESLSQEELVRRAFVAPSEQDLDDEFMKEKLQAEERDDSIKVKETNPKTAFGWGSWAGEGAPPAKPPKRLPKHLQPPEKKLPKRKRQDENKPNVIINEKRIKKTANSFQLTHIPYPYKTREEYEVAISGGLGKEWNVTSSVKNLTRPDIMTRAGKIIQPLSKRAKQVRPAAKF